MDEWNCIRQEGDISIMERTTDKAILGYPGGLCTAGHIRKLFTIPANAKPGDYLRIVKMICDPNSWSVKDGE